MFATDPPFHIFHDMAGRWTILEITFSIQTKTLLNTYGMFRFMMDAHLQVSRMPMGAGPRAVTEAGRRAVRKKATSRGVECRLRGCLGLAARWRYPQLEHHVIPEQGGSR